MPDLITQTFKNSNIRIIIINDKPWFVARDIIKALQYPPGKGIANRFAHIPNEYKILNKILTNGGIQKMICISEYGLYFFLMRSDSKITVPFQRWIAEFVLPSIHKISIYNTSIFEHENIYINNSKDFLGFIYAVEWNNMIKIGCTTNPCKRIQNLKQQAEGYSFVKFSLLLLSAPHTNYMDNEKKLHKIFYLFRRPGTELFDITLEQVKREIDALEFQNSSDEKKSKIHNFFDYLTDFVKDKDIKYKMKYHHQMYEKKKLIHIHEDQISMSI